MEILNFIIMNNEEQEKQVWQMPEVIDLDVNNTSGGIFIGDESSPSHPTS